MKRFLYALLGMVVTTFGLSSCEKEENKVYFEGGTAPVLTASRTGAVPLAFANASAEALTLRWTNPDYRFTTGNSSQNVTYALEIDTVGANFSSRTKRTFSISNDLSKTFTQAELNDVLLNSMELRAGRTYNIEMRVISSLNGSTAALNSNALRFTATPYAIPPKVQPYMNRINGVDSVEVFIVGNATPGDWNNPVPVPSQRMKQISPTLYEVTLPLTGGNYLLFLPENGSWARKYGFAGDKDKNNPESDEFTREGADIKVPAASGNYKVELNFQTGRYKITRI